MKAIFLIISIIAAILVIGLTLSGIYIIVWGDLAFIQVALAVIGAGAAFGLLLIAALLAAMLSKMTGKG